MSNFVKPFLGLLLVVMLVSSCKDELITTGELKVTYANHPDDLVAVISPAENTSIYISGTLTPASNGILTYNLNSGNYVLKTSSATFFPEVGFQIRPGETTLIFFDSNNTVHVD